MTAFLENIESAYRSLESKLNQGERLIAENPHMKSCFPKRLWIEVPDFPQPDGDTILLLPLGDCYLLKVHTDKSIASIPVNDVQKYLRSICTYMLECVYNSFQETNEKILADHGFTQENGFIIPRHKVIGVETIDGLAHVIPDGHGWTIVEDMSEGGKYPVIDIQPHHFATLKNRHEFTESYARHLTKLLEVYNHPSIDPNVNRHPKPDNPYGPLSRMLLLKIKEGIGQIIIGDLDNVEFKPR